ncbi:hypothetical protein WMY93_002470 [Mugilogobius chulae]|uniref:Medium-chain acyl-CoA ligase ACSF2, mitochondrial n=1 Tax=Mugilogobius chulae TaxID=88201 RepID=A0AAW0PWN7_9GOBI
MYMQVDRLAAGLLALGLKPGDRVGVWGPNSYEWILSQFATAKAGMILVSLNPAYQLKEIEFTLKKVQCKAVICPSSFKTQRFSQMLQNLCPEIDPSSKNHFQSSRLPDLRMVIVMDCTEPGMLHFQDAMEAGESRHHKELMDLQSKLTFDDPINIQFTSFVCVFLFPCITVWLCAWRHVYGVHGITLVFPCKGYNSQANLKAIQNERCNIVYGTPTMHTDMLSQRDLHTFDFRQLKEVIYGTTENSPVTFLGFPLDSDELKLNTATVVDPVTGVTVPLGASGELLIRGYCVMLGYWEDEAKTREAIGKDRWYRTGDIASLNSKGYCAIEGRIKDLIIRGGENIYQDGQSCTPEEIQGYCKGQISHFKIPHYVMFIKKVTLKENMEKQLGLQ